MNKQVLQNSIIKELRIVKRLFTKLPLEHISFQPHQNVRNTIDLLQYLSICGTSMLGFWLDKHELDFMGYFGTVRTIASSTNEENFIQKIDEEIAQIEKYFSIISNEDLQTKLVALPGGNQIPMGEALIETSIKWLTAYKMQLFLYIKISSGQDLKTADLWRLTDLTL